jgi:hypothetical protein
MRSLSLTQLEAEADRFDEAAAGTARIDAFCSSTDWGIPAHLAFMPDRTPRIWRGAHGYLALMEHVREDGARLWLPLELVWGLGSPLLGASARALVGEVVALLRHGPEWDAVVLTGLAPDAPLASALVELAPRNFRVGVTGPPTRRAVVDLADGVDAYLGRRSPKFRRGVLRARDRAAQAGITFETGSGGVADAQALFARVMAVEHCSWKGREGVGLAVPQMEAFYRVMLERLVRRGRLALTFARHQGQDVGYVLGARFAGTYRGLQFSYDQDHAALGLGNALQLDMMERLERQGIGLYDLGAEVEYKRRWCDRLVETSTFVLRRPRR